MGKLSWLFFFLLFMVCGGLFFAGGFLTCSVLFPSTPPGLVSPTLSSSSNENGYPQTLHNSDQSYANRQALLHSRSSSRTQTLLQKAEYQSEDQARKMSKSAIGMVLEEWSQKIRTALGPILGAAVVPMTTGLARSAVDTALSNTYSLSPNSQQSPQTAQAAGDAVNLSAAQNASTPAASENPSLMVDLYTIHVQDFTSMIDANNLLKELEHRHFGAYIVRLSAPKGLVFSVRVGRFKGFKDAQAVATTLTQMWDYPVRVIRIDNNINTTGMKR